MPGSTGPNFGLVSGWSPGDEGWDSQSNRNLRDLDAFGVHAAVAGVRTAPPVGPADGDRYLVGAGTGAFAGHDGELAAWRDSSATWEFVAPKPGWKIWREDLGVEQVFNGTDWRQYTSGTVADAFATLQDAVDATPSGGTLLLGHRVYQAPPGGLLITRPIEIKGPGVGPFDDQLGAWITPNADAAGEPAIVIHRSATLPGWVSLHDFGIVSSMDFDSGAALVRKAGAHGISIVTDAPGVDGVSIPLENISLRRLTIGGMGDRGVSAVAYDGSSNCINNLTIEQVKVSYCAGDGMYLFANVICGVRDCYVHRCAGRGIIALLGGYNLLNNTIEGCATDATLDHYQDGQVVLYAVRPLTFMGNHIEAFADGTVVGGVPVQRACRALVIRGSVSGSNTPPWEPLNGYDGGGFTVEGNIFVQAAEVGDNLVCSPTLEPRAIYIDFSCEGYFRIGHNFHRNVNVPVEVAATSDYAVPGVTVDPQCVEIGNAYVASEGIQLPAKPSTHFRDLSGVANKAELAGHIQYDTTLGCPRHFTGDGWALTNNAPQVTTAERDARTWRAGDIAWNTTTNALECYTGSGTTWKTVCSMA